MPKTSSKLFEKIATVDLKKLDKHIIENFVKPHKDAELEVDKDVYWVEGFLCAVFSSANFVRMDDWLPYVNGDCKFKSQKHAEEIMLSIFQLQNNILAELADISYKPLYEKFNIKDEVVAALAARWSKGYVLGGLLINGENFFRNEDTATLLSPIFILASDDEKELQKRKIEKKDLLKMVPIAANGFSEYNRYSKTKHPRVSTKVSRNDLCPCGSKKKFKKCCGDVA